MLSNINEIDEIFSALAAICNTLCKIFTGFHSPIQKTPTNIQQLIKSSMLLRTIIIGGVVVIVVVIIIIIISIIATLVIQVIQVQVVFGTIRQDGSGTRSDD